MAEIEISKAVPADFEALAALDREAWGDNRHSRFVPDGEHTWRIWCEYAVTHTARQEGLLLGAVVAFPVRDGRYCLHKILVAKPARSRGVGSRLFEAAMADLDRMGVACFLTVDPVNERAIGLYEKYGFVKGELVRGFYRNYEDRWVMQRQPGGGR